MKVWNGKSVCKGIAMGPVVVMKKKDFSVTKIKVSDPEAEISRVTAAVDQAKSQLQEFYEKALREVGESSAMIFMIHQMLLEDETLLDAVYTRIRSEQVNAEYAVSETGNQLAEMFAGMDDDYMKERAADLKDISDRLVRILTGCERQDFCFSEPSILLADDLAPSETMQLDQAKILAFVTVRGSENSHTAILARTMNIPALVGVPVDLDEIQDGLTAIVDGSDGRFVIEPEDAVRMEAEAKINEEHRHNLLLEDLKGKENVTLDGKHIDIFANIGSVDDVKLVLEQDAGGIGLFRSEFLYLGRDTFPTEEEQFQAYRQVLQAMGDKKVII
ncbi:MAG: phosphoenolpyruvate--protein phosphotransferase, partial [Lachnospiraceae bacterium]|nr:phosphoenolpyruvate--protein phosphotransferase [Lachnospiraceae bacterium]